jgi:hypothetical protein
MNFMGNLNEVLNKTQLGNYFGNTFKFNSMRYSSKCNEVHVRIQVSPPP